MYSKTTPRFVTRLATTCRTRANLIGAPALRSVLTRNMASFPAYATTFPGVPRANGIAKVTVGASASDAADKTIVRFVTKEELPGKLGGDLAAKDAASDSVHVVYSSHNGKETRVLYVSLGAAKSLDLAAVKRASNAAVTKLRGLKLTTPVEFVQPSVESVPAAKVTEGLVQAAALTNFHFDRYLTQEDKVPAFLTAVHVALPEGLSGDDTAAAQAAGQAAAVLAECTIYARDFCNERADEMNPGRVEAEARRIAQEIGAEVTVVSGQALVQEGLHLLYSVGQAAGAARPDSHAPRYIEIAYKGDPEHPEDVILVVGKCITFDSGGLNIKGTGFMEDMHMDKGGAAAVMGTMLALKRLGVKRNVVGVATAAENAIDSLAYKPHAIIRSHKGLTVEIGNTDAEGRLALADALSYGQARHKPHTVIDLATLTGACIVGLGEYAAGMFTNNSALKERLLEASHTRGERLWPMPIFPEHSEELKASAHADLMSTGAGRYGGACTAAAFLQYFIGHGPAKNARETQTTPVDAPAPATPAWAHLDIAGPAMYSKARGHMPAGGTGFGVQVVAQYILDAPKGALPADTPRKY